MSAVASCGIGLRCAPSIFEKQPANFNGGSWHWQTERSSDESLSMIDGPSQPHARKVPKPSAEQMSFNDGCAFGLCRTTSDSSTSWCDVGLGATDGHHHLSFPQGSGATSSQTKTENHELTSGTAPKMSQRAKHRRDKGYNRHRGGKNQEYYTYWYRTKARQCHK